jgi:hypothetical protein
MAFLCFGPIVPRALRVARQLATEIVSSIAVGWRFGFLARRPKSASWGLSEPRWLNAPAWQASRPEGRVSRVGAAGRL